MRLGDLDALKEYMDRPFWEKWEWEFISKSIDNAQPVEIATKLQQGEWIPVSERLPIRNGVYNVTRKLKEGETIYFISDASYFDGQNTWHRDVCVNHGRPYLTDIIAWQPLPEPYKEGDSNGTV